MAGAPNGTPRVLKLIQVKALLWEVCFWAKFENLNINTQYTLNTICLNTMYPLVFIKCSAGVQQAVGNLSESYKSEDLPDISDSEAPSSDSKVSS